MRASNYARLKVAGKLTWRTLGTKLLSVAQHELSELLKDQEILQFLLLVIHQAQIQ